MNRRTFVQQAVGAVGAAVALSRASIAETRAAEPIATDRCAEPRIRGSFFDLAHPNLWDAAYWTDSCRLWKEECWRALIRDMHGIGIDTAICTATALWGRPLFGGYEKTVGLPLHFGCPDPLGACVDEAESLGMKMFFGVGLRGRCCQVRDYARMDRPWPDEWFQWNTALARAILDRFGHRPCFAGLYLAYEIDFHDIEVELYEKLVHEHLRPAVGKVKLLASPGNLGVELSDDRVDHLPKLVERTGIDILAPQDYGGRTTNIREAVALVARQVEVLKRVRQPLAKIGVTLWSNCEVFDFESNPDGRGRCIAGPIERIRQQMAMQAPLVEKLICYQYQGCMNRHTDQINIGHPATDRLYQDYVAYLKEKFP